MVQAHLEAQTLGRIPEWPNGADCKSAVYDFGGSNPSAPTIVQRTIRKQPRRLKRIRLDVINAKIAQLVEHDLAKVGVAGSSPVFRSRLK